MPEINDGEPVLPIDIKLSRELSPQLQQLVSLDPDILIIDRETSGGGETDVEACDATPRNIIASFILERLKGEILDHYQKRGFIPPNTLETPVAIHEDVRLFAKDSLSDQWDRDLGKIGMVIEKRACGEKRIALVTQGPYAGLLVRAHRDYESFSEGARAIRLINDEPYSGGYLPYSINIPYLNARSTPETFSQHFNFEVGINTVVRREYKRLVLTTAGMDTTGFDEDQIDQELKRFDEGSIWLSQMLEVASSQAGMDIDVQAMYWISRK